LIKKLFLIALISLSFTPVNATTTSSSLLFTPIQQTPKAAYQDQHLLLFGVEGPGVVEIYSIIGNKIKEIKVQELANFKSYLELDSGNMYIIRVTVSNQVHTLKLVAH
jgi:hypothetical protein